MGFLRTKGGQTVPAGVPGVTRHTPDTGPMQLTTAAAGRIGAAEIARAAALLTRYKDGKANLERRVVEDERWYQLRHWEVIRRQSTDKARPEPTSAWLFNALMNKHADAMDNFPEPNVLPRERGDEADAQALSSILPVILEHNQFEETYSNSWWEKLKHGTAAYGVFWNRDLENGLGDIDIRGIDLLNLFWEPGVSDLQKSRNLFVVDLRDIDLLEAEYPQHRGKLSGNVIDVEQYSYDTGADTQGKVAVVDWYYKVRSAAGRTLLHYAKFVGSTLLFASENDPAYAERGWYDHGEYPIVLDTLFPEKGTPCGFGYVAITKDPQLYIDKLGQSILENALLASKPRYFAGSNTGINEEEFLDWSKPVVHVQGGLEETRLKQIVVSPLNAVYLNVLQMKIDELKETAANRDFAQGSAGSGVTAAAAIAALQEAGNKSSRDMIAASYRAYTRVDYLCIELVRQFYDEARSFRITGQTGNYSFVDYSNAGIQDHNIAPAYPGQDAEEGFVPLVRRPVFDITVKAQKKNPFSRMSQNELAKELYGLGFFRPERAQEALGALELMAFEGKERVLEQVRQGQTLLNTVQGMAAQMDKMALVIQQTTGVDLSGAAEQAPNTSGAAPAGNTAPAGGIGAAAAQAERGGMTGYGDRLAARSKPNMDAPE